MWYLASDIWWFRVESFVSRVSGFRFGVLEFRVLGCGVRGTFALSRRGREFAFREGRTRLCVLLTKVLAAKESTRARARERERERDPLNVPSVQLECRPGKRSVWLRSGQIWSRVQHGGVQPRI